MIDIDQEINTMRKSLGETRQQYRSWTQERLHREYRSLHNDQQYCRAQLRTGFGEKYHRAALAEIATSRKAIRKLIPGLE
jgi:hypothetical protein